MVTGTSVNSSVQAVGVAVGGPVVSVGVGPPGVSVAVAVGGSGVLVAVGGGVLVAVAVGGAGVGVWAEQMSPATTRMYSSHRSVPASFTVTTKVAPAGTLTEYCLPKV